MTRERPAVCRADSITGFLIALLLTLAASVSHAEPIAGILKAPSGAPLQNTFLALMSAQFQPVENTLADAEGKFSLPENTAGTILVVQPPAHTVLEYQAFQAQPRIFVLDQKRSNLQLALPAAGNLVLVAYDPQGKLLLWGDFEKRGKTGGQFMYATNLDDEAIAATPWPIWGGLAGATSGPREKGLAGLLVTPGTKFALNVMFWEVPDYGKLLLKADNRGVGYSFAKAGDAQPIQLNYELAATAVSDLLRRKAVLADAASIGKIDPIAARLDEVRQIPPGPEQAKAADALLGAALRLRDTLEIEHARLAIPAARMGKIVVKADATGAQQKTGAAATVHFRQKSHDFLFGAFEGSPYNAAAFETARKGGFELATVLLGWNWTQDPKVHTKDIYYTFGVGQLKTLGYKIKGHGMVWIQDYGIMPDRVKTLSHEALIKEELEHQKALIETLNDKLDICEAINEPANTNTVNLSREQMSGLMASAAADIHAAKKPALVNSPHEFGYGGKYLLYNTDNKPTNDFVETFSAFLRENKPALKGVDILGLQLYPGFHLNSKFADQQGPAFTPSCVQDILDRYAAFKLPIHITELSLPSSYGKDWYSGYWREPWTEQTQADYAEALYILAFAHPQVHSIGWWDILDAKPSVITGGLLHADLKPKPVFDRITGLIKSWTSDITEKIAPGDTREVSLYAGDYDVEIAYGGQQPEHRALHVQEGMSEELNLSAAESKPEPAVAPPAHVKVKGKRS